MVSSPTGLGKLLLGTTIGTPLGAMFGCTGGGEGAGGNCCGGGGAPTIGGGGGGISGCMADIQNHNKF
ncbi:MAG TPA: hypothetical protein HA340_00385 [Candidatus Thalassarchaeaceae archaeon]|nr:hypothetical protein [Candidatus Thalassarchaeaceae archaeon]|tara:strand:- start:2483 stop:2686 length:204 start_codon:yes stop_codon:yes gene_type:complete